MITAFAYQMPMITSVLRQMRRTLVSKGARGAVERPAVSGS
jgi:hypothetical protein